MFINSNILIVLLFCFSAIQCDTHLVNLHEIAQVKKFFQMTLFRSDNFTKSLNLKSFIQTPKKIYSININNQHWKLYDETSENSRNYYYSLQESLIIFYSNDLNETSSFVDFLVPKLTARTRPKCLIVYFCEHNESKDETYIVSIFNYAWENKFLDFTILEDCADKEAHSSFVIYYFNPFCGVVYRKVLSNGNTEIFPDKLQNAYRHPFKIEDLGIPDGMKRYNFSKRRRLNHEIKISPTSLFALNFVAEILNLCLVNMYDIESDNDATKWDKSNLDILFYAIANNISYCKDFILPIDQRAGAVVAVVPIFHNFKINFYVIFLYFVVITLGIVSTFYCLMNRCKTALRHFSLWDIIRLLLGQSISRGVQKNVHRIIYFTLIVGSVKIMNDLLLNAMLFFFENTEVPFETFKDLYNSQLQTYTSKFDYSQINLKESTNDHYFLKIIEKTLSMDWVSCVNIFIENQDVSCFMYDYIAEYTVSSFPSIMKIAKPPITEDKNLYYWFVDGSPYDTKFYEILQRIREGNLMHWYAVAESRSIFDFTIGNTGVKVNENVIKIMYLIIVLGFGLSVSIIVFNIKLIQFKFGIIITKFLSNGWVENLFFNFSEFFNFCFFSDTLA